MELFPHVVEQGDYLGALAVRHGFDADAVWKDSNNDQLRKQGRTQNTLLPGDIVYIPQPKRKWISAKVGESNSFSARLPTTSIKITLISQGAPLANEKCIVHLAEPTKLTTDGSGVLSLDVPTQQPMVTVEIPRLSAVQTFGVGHLDPETTPSGVRQRLVNLGYAPFGEAELQNPERFAAAISAFQKAQGVMVTGVLCDATRAALKTAHGV